MQKIKKFSFLFLAFVVVMGCNTKNKEDHSAHQEGESILYLLMDLNKGRRQAW
jgi:Cu(I)/Ag(I) efflux system membrane fusion protein